VAKKITLVRHGRSVSNDMKLAAGHADFPLSKEGQIQAEKVGKRLKNKKYDLIVSSDLLRARQTALPIKKNNKGVKYYEDEGFRERRVGILRYMVENRIKSLTMKEFKGLRFKFGETKTNFKKRVWKSFEKILKSHKKNILIVSHAGTIKTIVSLLFKKKKHVTSNTGVVEIEINDKGNAKLITDNCIKHLEDL
jgi:broad specificity phosphatase PhoE